VPLAADRTTNQSCERSATSLAFDGRRIYAALIFVPLFYVLVRYGTPVAFFTLVTAAALLALVEFYRLYFLNQRVPIVAMALGLSLSGLLLASLQWPDLISERVVLLLSLMAVLMYRLGSRRSLSQSLIDSAVLIFGILYISLTLGHLLLTRAQEGGQFLIFFVVLVTWASDTGAYYVGRTLGRHRLAPMVSPNKTVEGLIGGLVLAVLLALVARAWFLPSFTVVDCLATGVLLSLAGSLGDLAESVLKRSAGVKDSGTILPGHGGMLDRLDSLLFTAPVFYYYVSFVKGSAT